MDEDVAIQVIEPLRRVLQDHDVDHIKKIGWASKEDRYVFADARKKGYDVLVTKNIGQLSDPEECTALKRSGLHHVVYEQKDEGLEGLGKALGSIFAALPGIVRRLETESSQRLVRIVAVAGTRFEVTDPAVDPPTYWPR